LSGTDVFKTKSIDNLVNKIIAENFPNLEKEMEIQVQEVYRTPNHQNQTRNTPRHIKYIQTNKNTQYAEERKNIENCKSEKTSQHKGTLSRIIVAASLWIE
jgi:hypothetical protein